MHYQFPVFSLDAFANSVRITSFLLGHLYGSPSATGMALKDVCKIDRYLIADTQQIDIMCSYLLGRSGYMRQQKLEGSFKKHMMWYYKISKSLVIR